MDAEKIRKIAQGRGDRLDMWEFVRAHDEFRTWRMVRDRAVTAGDKENAAFVEGLLAKLPEISDLDALRVMTRLADHLMRCRYYVMVDAREGGASWADIAIAVGLADEHDSAEKIKDAADTIRAWYVGEIEMKERHIPDLHDVARSRAVVDDDPPSSGEPQ